MKKHLLPLLVCLLLAALPALATAEEMVLTPTFYDPINDLPKSQQGLRDLSDEAIKALRHGSFTSVHMLPLPEDVFLLYGTFQYHDLVMEESHRLGFDREIPRTDAYAIALDADGKRLWSLRFSDPQAENGFGGAWLLPDERILLKYANHIGETESIYFIVSRSGEIEDMLHAIDIKHDDQGVFETLHPFLDGFYGGGFAYDRDSFSRMHDAVNLSFYDADLALRWRITDETLLDATFFEPRATPDGILLPGSMLGFEIIDGVEYTWGIPTLLKVTRDGDIVWQYVGHEYATDNVADARGTTDGGALILTSVDPAVATPFMAEYAGMLSKLDAEGTLEWTKEYLKTEGFATFEQIFPYRDGFMICGQHTSGKVGLLYIDEAGTPLQRMIVDHPEGVWAYGMLTEDNQGRLYLYGMVETYQAQGEEDLLISDGIPFYLSLDGLVLGG